MNPTTTIADQVADLTETASGQPNPLHNVVDTAKRDALVANLFTHGWTGAPIVIDGDNAITGAHRIAAVAELLRHHGVEIHIPRVDVRDLCATNDLDWDAIMADAGDWYEAVQQLGSRLPTDVTEYLGLDAH